MQMFHGRPLRVEVAQSHASGRGPGESTSLAAFEVVSLKSASPSEASTVSTEDVPQAQAEVALGIATEATAGDRKTGDTGVMVVTVRLFLTLLVTRQLLQNTILRRCAFFHLIWKPPAVPQCRLRCVSALKR